MFKDIEGRNAKPLDQLTLAEEQLFATARSAFPFVDIAGRYEVGTQYGPVAVGAPRPPVRSDNAVADVGVDEFVYTA